MAIELSTENPDYNAVVLHDMYVRFVASASIYSTEALLKVIRSLQAPMLGSGDAEYRLQKAVVKYLQTVLDERPPQEGPDPICSLCQHPVDQYGRCECGNEEDRLEAARKRVFWEAE